MRRGEMKKRERRENRSHRGRSPGVFNSKYFVTLILFVMRKCRFICFRFFFFFFFLYYLWRYPQAVILPLSKKIKRGKKKHIKVYKTSKKSKCGQQSNFPRAPTSYKPPPSHHVMSSASWTRQRELRMAGILPWGVQVPGQGRLRGPSREAPTSTSHAGTRCCSAAFCFPSFSFS